MKRTCLRWRAWSALLLLMIGGVVAAAPGPSARRVESIKHRHEAKLGEVGLAPEELRVYSIGKSHLDAAFTWRLAETRAHKVPYTFKQAIEHMRQYPTFTYHQSSAQFYEWIKADDPALFAEIQEAEAQGRWVIVGGMWIEPDGNMPDGESFVRQFLYGQRFFIENFGHGAELVWMEDTFGFNWNLPQIAKKSGANSFYTLKLLWNLRNQFPFHLFHWQAPDGSRLLAHIAPILSGVNPALQPYFPYDEFMPGPDDYFLNPISAKVGFPWDYHFGYRQTRLLLKPGAALTANYLSAPAEISAKLSDELMPVVGGFYGAGDGGHGPIKQEIEDQLALEQAGYARMGTSDQLFADFASYSDRLPVWDDELYLEYHQGVFTTHERVKRQNRAAETRMRQTESAAAVATLAAGEVYPSDELEELWKLTLLNQFHDILPGTGIREVYQDADVHYAQIQDRTGELLESSLSALAGGIDARPPRPNLQPLTVFNPLGWERQDLVRHPAPDGASYRVFDQSGRELPAQSARSEEGESYILFMPGPLPPLGWKTFYLEPGEPAAEGGPTVRESAEALTLENELIALTIDRASGWIVSLFDKTLDRELLGGPSNKLLAFTDQPLGYPAWNLSEDYQEKPIEVPAVSAITVTDQGPVLARVLIERQGETSFKQWITIERGSPLAPLVTWTDLHWKDALIKLEFNTALETAKVPAEIPYATIERSTQPTTPWDKARTEMPCNKWLDLSDGRAGLALLNFGGHGFSISPDGRGYRMSIVKSAVYPRPELDATRVDRLVAWRLKASGQTDPGAHRSDLALLPHPGDWREGKLYRAGYEFNTPALTLAAPAGAGPLPAQFSPLELDSPSVIITSVKQAEDDGSIVARLVEFEGADTRAALRVNAPFTLAGAWETDLLELNARPLAHGVHGLEVAVGHFEIKTIKLKLRKE